MEDDAMMMPNMLDLLFGHRPSILEDFGQPVEEPMSIRETAQAQLERNEAERRRLITRLALLDQFGEDDPWPDGTVLTFKRDFGGPQTYTYMAARIAGTWYTTGLRSVGASFTWPQLVEEHLSKCMPRSLYVVSHWVRYEDA